MATPELAKVLRIDVINELPKLIDQLFATLGWLVGAWRYTLTIENLIVHKDRRSNSNCERYRVRGTTGHDFAVRTEAEVEFGEVNLIVEVGDDHLVQSGSAGFEDVAEQIVGHWARCGSLLEAIFHRSSLGQPHSYGKHSIGSIGGLQLKEGLFRDLVDTYVYKLEFDHKDTVLADRRIGEPSGRLNRLKRNARGAGGAGEKGWLGCSCVGLLSARTNADAALVAQAVPGSRRNAIACLRLTLGDTRTGRG